MAQTNWVSLPQFYQKDGLRRAAACPQPRAEAKRGYEGSVGGMWDVRWRVR
jgi:hypothetical protein